jgi:uncharacterized membrane protein
MLENAELVLAGTNNSPWYWWDHSGWYWAMGFHGILWMALIVVAIVVLTRLSRRSLNGVENTANTVLDTRYASGEINRGEYLERKRDLA